MSSSLLRLWINFQTLSIFIVLNIIPYSGEKIMWRSLKEIFKLLGSISTAQLAGALGSIFTRTSVSTWYKSLSKPKLAPSGRFIAVVWIILYTLMGISAYLVSRKGSDMKEVKGALSIYKLQLGLNVLWSFAFFGLRSALAGLGMISLLWGSIVVTILKFRKISGAAALLLIPYLIWVSIAGYLNYSIWRLNPKD